MESPHVCKGETQLRESAYLHICKNPSNFSSDRLNRRLVPKIMKNKVVIAILGSIFLSLVLGCGFLPFVGSSDGNSQGNDNKTLTDHAVDTAIGEEKIGIAECDEVVEFFQREMNNADDDFVTKAVKGTILNKMKEQFKKSLEENKTDKAEMAKSCKDFKAQLEKYKAEEANKQK